MLVAAMNPCRCGRANDPGFACKRGPNARWFVKYIIAPGIQEHLENKMS